MWRFSLFTSRSMLICGILTAGAALLSSCQPAVTGVDAVIQQDEVRLPNVKQRDAFAAFESGQFAVAVQLFEQAIAVERDPGARFKLFNGLGLSYTELNQHSKAIDAYLEALKLDPENAQVWVNLGISQRLIRDYDQALKSYKAALDLDSSLATAHSSIGSLRVLRGQPELAIQAFKSAIAIDANLAVTHGNLALAYAMINQFEQAQQSLERAIALGYENGDLIQFRIDGLKQRP